MNSDRIEGTATGIESPFGLVPADGEIDHAAAGVDQAGWAELFAMDKGALTAEAEDAAGFLASYGDRVPAELHAELAAMRARIDRLD